jgi:thymidylate synthase
VSLADDVFKKMLQKILNEGFTDQGQDVRPYWSDGTPAHTIKKFGVVNRYDLSQEFPILTLRPTAFKLAINEILWIWQKKSNNVNELGSKIWNNWTDEKGTIGKAYGYQLSIKHKYPEGEFDQVDRVLFDLASNPYSRRIIVNMYNHNDLHKMNLYPCAYSMTFNVTNGKLNGILHQRSSDVILANNWNVVQYAILLHMFAISSNLKVGELIHVIADAHIYDRHIPIAEELLQRPSYQAPKLMINPNVTDFYQFKEDDFVLDNYVHGEEIKRIPVAI